MPIRPLIVGPLRANEAAARAYTAIAAGLWCEPLMTGKGFAPPARPCPLACAAMDVPNIWLPTLEIIVTIRRLGRAYGADIADLTGQSPRNVYRILRRLAEMGWAVAEEEDAAVAHAAGRPTRLYYRLTSASKPALDALYALHAVAEGGPVIVDSTIRKAGARS